MSEPRTYNSADGKHLLTVEVAHDKVWFTARNEGANVRIEISEDETKRMVRRLIEELDMDRGNR